MNKLTLKMSRFKETASSRLYARKNAYTQRVAHCNVCNTDIKSFMGDLSISTFIPLIYKHKELHKDKKIEFMFVNWNFINNSKHWKKLEAEKIDKEYQILKINLAKNKLKREQEKLNKK